MLLSVSVLAQARQMITPNITMYCHDFDLVPKISCVAGNRNHCSHKAASYERLVHRGDGIVYMEKGMGEKASDFLQQAFHSNVLYHPGSKGVLCLVSEKVLVMHRMLYLTGHIRGQVCQAGDVSTVGSLLVVFSTISHFYFLPSSFKSHETSSSSPISLSFPWGLHP